MNHDELHHDQSGGSRDGGEARNANHTRSVHLIFCNITCIINEPQKFLCGHLYNEFQQSCLFVQLFFYLILINLFIFIYSLFFFVIQYKAITVPYNNLLICILSIGASHRLHPKVREGSSNVWFCIM